MPAVVQFAAGILTGLMAGLALGLLRPLVVLLVLGSAGLIGVTLYQSGIDGLVQSLDRLAIELRFYAPFFTALAVGKIVGMALASKR
jgi:hypothetical protein